MAIQVTIQDPKKAIALLQFLISFKLIDSFEIIENTSINEGISEQDASFFDEFYGNTPELNIGKFKAHLNE